MTGMAAAQGYPAAPIRLVVPFPPAGGTDTLSRVVAQAMNEQRGWSMVIDNKPGAGGNLGLDIVAKAKPDGYTLLIGAVHHTIATSVYRKLAYDFQKDLAPVSTVAMVPNVLVVNPASGIQSVADLTARMKARPGQLNYASNGNGTSLHLSAELYKSLAGVFVTAFYSFRMYFLVFWGRERYHENPDAHHHAGHHAHHGVVAFRAAAGEEHMVHAFRGQLGDGLALALTKGRFALDLENRGHAHTGARFDFVVGVVEGFAGFTRQSAPDGGFTRPHQPDQKEIASNMYHARHSTQRPAARATLQRSIGPCVWLGGARVGRRASLRPCLLCVNGV